MKYLNLRRMICLSALLVLVCFASSLFVPSPAIAKVDYTNGSGMAEGDPGDGLGFTSGGGGLLPDGGNSGLAMSVMSKEIVVGIYVPGYLAQHFFVTIGIKAGSKEAINPSKKEQGTVLN